MNKQDIIDFFNRLAPQWDADMIRDDSRIGKILDIAGVVEGVRVLDVACGTGVLIPDYLARNVKKITAVDISPDMIQIAKGKFNDPRVEFINADVQETVFPELFDTCVIYNAFPHFPEPERLIETLAGKLAPGGRLTIAHGMSRDKINGHHSDTASKVSVGLMSETELAALFKAHFTVDTAISTDEIYVVSGTL